LVVSRVLCKRFSAAIDESAFAAPVAVIAEIPCWAYGGYTRGRQPSCGGAGGIAACQRFLLARSVLPAWGAPSRPGFPLGETGKGFKFLAAAGHFCPVGADQMARNSFLVAHRSNIRFSGSGRPGSARPTASGSGSTPASSAEWYPTWR
jgi:hypothetical protein